MRSLAVKLSLSFLAVSLFGIILIAVLTRYNVSRQSETFQNTQAFNFLSTQLINCYEDLGEWPDSDRDRRRCAPENIDRNIQWTVFDNQDNAVFRRPNTAFTNNEIADGIPIQVNNETVGTLVFRIQSDQNNRGDRNRSNDNDFTTTVDPREEFLETTNQFLLLSALSAAALSLGLGIVISRSLTKPVIELTEATRAIAAGNLDRQVEIKSADELGELGRAFNQMGHDLSQSQSIRRQMTADIAHDLRTPLSIILGHAEGVKDGVLPAEETVNIIHDEALRLNRLIEDLRTLSLADAGELELVRRRAAPSTLIERTMTAHLPQAQSKSVTISAEIEPDLPDLNLDPDRMVQVFDNLVSNALRYTPEGGQVTLGAARQNGTVLFKIADTGAGIASEQLDHIFDRFYRADASRTRGGSGLGLAISRSIVEQHGGVISAESQVGHGTTITIKLPV